MAGVNTILPFNLTGENMLSDETYATDSQRINGLTSGIARSNLMNKALHQTTTVCAAIGDFLASKGYTVNDTNYTLLSQRMANFFDNYVKGDTLSINEGVYRNLFLTANISTDMNNLALGKDTPYGITHGLGYTFIYKFNITNSAYKEVLKVCDNRHDIAMSSKALKAMYNVEDLKKYWRSNLFLTQGRVTRKNEIIGQNLPSNITNTYLVKRIPGNDTLFLSSEGKNTCYYSTDGNTWNAMRSGRLYFSSDYKYIYIIYNESSDGGETWYCYDANDPSTIVNRGNLTVKYGSVQSSRDFCIWESEGSYWLFVQYYGGSVFAWYEAFCLPSPTQLTHDNTYRIFNTNIGYDGYINTYVVGSCILAGWSGKYNSDNKSGKYYVGFIYIKGNQIKQDQRISVDYTDYGNNTIYKFYPQFEPDSRSVCKLKMSISNGSGEEVRTYWNFDGDTGRAEQIDSTRFQFPSDWSVRYTYQLKTKTKYNYIIDSSGMIINDTLRDGKSFIFPTDFPTRYLQLIGVKGINSTETNNYAFLTPFIDNVNCSITGFVLDVNGKKIIKTTTYYDDEGTEV